MLAQTHDSGSNNNTLAEAMSIRLLSHAEVHGEEFKWNDETDRVRCICHKIALMVNAGLQALGIQAPPPPLVKLSILGAFPIPTNTLQTVTEEDETGEEQPQEDDLDSEPEHDDADVPASSDNSDWYDLDEGMYEDDVPFLESNQNEANVLHHLTNNVCFFSVLSIFIYIANFSPQNILVFFFDSHQLDIIGRKIGGSAVMCQLFDAVSISLAKKNLPRPIPGYGIRWNIKLQCWQRLYNAREVSLFNIFDNLRGLDQIVHGDIR